MANSLPAFVVIPAGALTVDFPLQAHDDTLLEGPVRVSLTGQADGFEVIPAETLVLDNEPSALALVLPSEIPEGSTRSAVFTLSAPFAGGAGELSSSDSTAVQTPRSLIVPPGVTHASFLLFAPEDGIVTGPQTVQVTATITGWPAASASIVALDNEAQTLEVILPTGSAEGIGTPTRARSA